MRASKCEQSVPITLHEELLVDVVVCAHAHAHQLDADAATTTQDAAVHDEYTHSFKRVLYCASIGDCYCYYT